MASPNNFKQFILGEVIWSAVVASVQNQAPTVDKELDIQNAEEVTIQVNSTDAANASTDFDINIHSSIDEGVTWDTTPYYAETTLGDAIVMTFLLSGGPQKIRFRLDNNDGANAATVTVKASIRS
jgi:hypothetical protein